MQNAEKKISLLLSSLSIHLHSPQQSDSICLSSIEHKHISFLSFFLSLPSLLLNSVLLLLVHSFLLLLLRDLFLSSFSPSLQPFAFFFLSSFLIFLSFTIDKSWIAIILTSSSFSSSLSFSFFSSLSFFYCY